jgi:hypothetical protein
MLLLAHLERDADSVAEGLRPDMAAALAKLPALLEEMVKLSAVPRPPAGAGWGAPAIASVQMLQSLAQAVPLRYRKAQGKREDPAAALMQLPFVNEEAVRRLKRRRCVPLFLSPSRSLLRVLARARARVQEAAVAARCFLTCCSRAFSCRSLLLPA